MAFEFPCSHCGKRISVPEGTWGRVAQCPYCERQMTIPAPVAAAIESSNPPVLLQTASTQPAEASTTLPPQHQETQPAAAGPTTGPIAMGPTGGMPAWGRSARPQSWAHGSGPSAARGRPINPTVMVMVGFFLALNGLLGMGVLGAEVWFFRSDAGQEALETAADQSRMDPSMNREQLMAAVVAILSVYAFFAAIASTLATIGGIQLARQKTRWLALAGAICGLVPTHPCIIVLSWPIAIAAIVIVVLHREAFE